VGLSSVSTKVQLNPSSKIVILQARNEATNFFSATERILARSSNRRDTLGCGSLSIVCVNPRFLRSALRQASPSTSASCMAQHTYACLLPIIFFSSDSLLVYQAVDVGVISSD
jgi:hypothetical protein